MRTVVIVDDDMWLALGERLRAANLQQFEEIIAILEDIADIEERQAAIRERQFAAARRRLAKAMG